MHIPYRSMLPTGISGLFVAGRAKGGGQGANAATRNMAFCAVPGQGAGNAASLGVKARCDLIDVDIKAVQGAFAKQGVSYLLNVPFTCMLFC